MEAKELTELLKAKIDNGYEIRFKLITGEYIALAAICERIEIDSCRSPELILEFNKWEGQNGRRPIDQ